MSSFIVQRGKVLTGVSLRGLKVICSSINYQWQNLDTLAFIYNIYNEKIHTCNH